MKPTAWTREHIIGLGLVLLALLMVASEAWLSVFPRGGDNAEFVLRAMSVAEGSLFQPAREAYFADSKFALVQPPLLPLLLAIPQALFGSLEATKFFFYLMQAAAVLFFWWALVRGGILPPIHAAIVTAISLFAMRTIAPVVNVDIPFAFVAPGIAVLLATAMKDRSAYRSFLLLGICFGMLVALRYSGVSWVVGGTLWLFVVTLRTNTRDAWARFGMFLAGGGAVALVLLGWLFLNDPNFLQWYTGVHTGEGNELTASSPLARIPGNVVLYSKQILYTLGSTWVHSTPLVMFMLSWILPVIAWSIWIHRRSGWVGMWIALLAIHPSVFVISFMPDLRYMYPLLPLLFIFLAVGLLDLAPRLPRIPFRTHGALVVLIVLFVVKGLVFASPLVNRMTGGIDAIMTPAELDFVHALHYADEHYSDRVIYLHTKLNIPSVHTGMKGVDTDEFEQDWSAFHAVMAAHDTVLVLDDDDLWDDPPGLNEWLMSLPEEQRRVVFAQNGTRVLELTSIAQPVP